jgi:hypothetical protein
MESLFSFHENTLKPAAGRFFFRRDGFPTSGTTISSGRTPKNSAGRVATVASGVYATIRKHFFLSEIVIQARFWGQSALRLFLVYLKKKYGQAINK